MQIPGQPPQRSAGKILKIMQIAIIAIVVVTISLAPQSEWFKGMVGGQKVQEKTQDGALVIEYMDTKENQKDKLLARIRLSSVYQDLNISDMVAFVEGVTADSIKDLKVMINSEEQEIETLTEKDRIFIANMDMQIPKGKENIIELFGTVENDTAFKVYIIDVVGKDANGKDLKNIGAKNDPFFSEKK